MEVKYVKWGLANRFNDRIEINENLRLYPELHNAILQHELSHTDKQGFNKEDFVLDIGPSKVNYWKLMKFMICHPRSFLQFAPFYKQNKVFIYDVNLCIVWGIMVSVIGIAAFLALKL